MTITPVVFVKEVSTSGVDDETGVMVKHHSASKFNTSNLETLTPKKSLPIIGRLFYCF